MNGLVAALVCGPRDGTGLEIVWKALDAARVHPQMPRFNMLVTGSRRGTDLEAFDWAIYNELVSVIYPAKWKTGQVGGKPEGMIRNADMYRWCTPALVLGFPSPGTGTAGMMKISVAGNTPSWWWSQPDLLWVLDERCKSDGRLPWG